MQIIRKWYANAWNGTPIVQVYEKDMKKKKQTNNTIGVLNVSHQQREEIVS